MISIVFYRPKVTYFKSVMAGHFDVVKLKNELSDYKIYCFQSINILDK